MNFDWNDLAFSSKKPINTLQAIFIAAPREMSQARINQIVKTYLPKGNIIFGLAKEDYIQGFESQSQFKTLKMADVAKIAAKVNAARLPHKIYTLSYLQREWRYVFEKLDFAKVLLINGSWHHSFHLRPEYYVLANRRIDYEMLSPFANEEEARAYAVEFAKSQSKPAQKVYAATEMLQLAAEAAKQSFDYTYQTGVALGQKQGDGYKLLATSFNAVVPYQTYALHFGSVREAHFSPPNDLNFYDTVHAEVALIVRAQQQKINLKNTTVFINLLPCPNCARMFTQTDIAEFVYHEDHSDGYAVDLLQKAGKKVTRIVG